MAFQTDVFQNDTFQIEAGAGVVGSRFLDSTIFPTISLFKEAILGIMILVNGIFKG